MTGFHTIDTLDPWRNLSIERYLCESVAERQAGSADIAEPFHRLVVWRNRSCLVIGRHQNPWVECDLGRMAADAVPLLRRISGGGAVYHDEGNVNFSFIGTKGSYDLDRHFAVVARALGSLGIRAERNERNDLFVAGRKVSGSAYRHTRGVSLHHGTLLLSTDIDLLNAYLMSPGSGVPPAGNRAQAVTVSKGIASVRSKVTNLAEHRPGLAFEEVADALQVAYEREYGAAEFGSPAESAGDAAEMRIAAHAAEFRSWEWTYGKTPSFTCVVQVSPRGPSLPRCEVAVRHGAVERVSLSGVRANAVGSVDEALRGTPFMHDDLLQRAHSLSGFSRELADAIAMLGGPGSSVVER